MKNIKRIIFALLLIPLAFLLYVIIVVSHGTLNDYVGPPSVEVPNEAPDTQEVFTDSTLSLMIWNIGYTGLGEEVAFFYDQGKFFHSGDAPVTIDKDQVEKNKAGMLSTLEQNPVDIYFLQEVDKNSKRSYYDNTFQSVSELLEGYSAHFGLNYAVKRVPIPIMEPFNVYGKVESGIATYSRYQTRDAERLQLPGTFSWPDRIFQLDRCLLVQRMDYKDKEIVLINLHNSAYDKGGLIKAQQMAFLKDYILEEYTMGNYVVVGGDWNQCPPDFVYDSLYEGDHEFFQANIKEDFMDASWTWAYDGTVSTNRKNYQAYVDGENFETLIDFYLLSPNIEVERVKGIDLSFRYSDHQPVVLDLRFL